jgi:uncharacterized protein (TIRG00374 family)
VHQPTHASDGADGTDGADAEARPDGARVPRRRRVARIALRLLGLGLVAFVLATQVEWTDAVVLSDGTRLEGTVRETADGFVVEQDGAPATPVPLAGVRRRAYGGREVPDVAYGLPSLARRASGARGEVAAVLALLVAMVVLTAWRWLTLVRAAGLRLGGGAAVRLSFIGSFFNLAVPGATGGDVVKAYYAAKATGAATRAVLSVFVDRAIGLLGLAILAAGALFLGPPREGYGPARVVVLALLAGGLLVAVVFLSRRVRSAVGLGALLRKLPFQAVLREADQALRLYRSRVPTIVAAIATSLVNHAVVAACVAMLADALRIPSVDLGSAMALVPVTALLSAVPLLPGGWGVGELAFAYFFGQVGVPATEAVALSVVFRLATLVASLPGGVLWISWKGHASSADIARRMDREREIIAARPSDDAPPLEETLA